MNQSQTLSQSDRSLHQTGGSTPPGAKAAGLRVSQAALRFDRTAPGDESFRILKITPPQANTPVVVTSSQPADFQVAVGVDQLRFEAELTFTPEPGGTYVHLRYKPGRAGRHRASLQVRTDQDEQTVALLGRTTGLAGRLLTRSAPPGNVPALPAPVKSAQPPLRAKQARHRTLRPALLMAGVACGLLSLAYVNRCTIWPSLCQPAAVVVTPAPTAAVPARSADKPPAPTTPTGTRKPRRSARPLTRPDAAESVAPVARLAPKRRPPTSPSANQSASARRPAGDSPRPRTSPTNARTANARAANAPVTVSKRPGGAESELERVLNRQD